MSKFNSVKVCIIGSCNVGKTSIILKYFNNNKNTDTTLGAIYWLIEQTSKCGVSYKINLWDTAGQERYNSLIPMYSRNSDIVLITFDLTDKSTFLELEKWIKIVKDNNPDSKIILVGNKCDQDIFRKIEKKDIDKLIRNNFNKSVFYIETSAISGVNIKNLFDKIFNISLSIIKQRKIETLEKDLNTINIESEQTSKFSCCSII